MKKLIYLFAAAIVAVAAVDAQAINLYKKDNFSWETKGDWQIQLRKEAGKNKDADVEYDDSEIQNRVTYTLPNKFSIYGQLDFGWEKASDTSDQDGKSTSFGTIEESYVGLQYDAARIQMGRTNTWVDKFGAHIAKENVLAKTVFWEAGRTDGDDLIMAAFENKRIFVGVGYEVEADSDSSAGEKDTTTPTFGDSDQTFTDIFAIATFGKLKVGAAYQYCDTFYANILQNTVKTKVLDKDNGYGIWGVMAAYDFGFARLAADYGVADDIETVYNVSVAVPVDAFTLQAGYINVAYDGNSADASQTSGPTPPTPAVKYYNSAAGAAMALVGDDTVSGWYGTVIYNFKSAKGCSVFAELSDTDAGKGYGDELGWNVGMNIKF